MILIINTVISGRLILGLVKNNKLIDKRNQMVGYRQAEKLLTAVDKLLKDHQSKVGDLRGVIVATGPGGFSSVRLGVVLANTLGYSLNIPVAGLPTAGYENLEELVEAGIKKIRNNKKFNPAQPFYGQEPHITKPKRLRA